MKKNIKKNKLAIFGGKKTRVKNFFPRNTMGINEEKASKRVIRSGVLSGFIGGPGKYFNGGKEVIKFEKNFSKKLGHKYSITTNSWTTGLQTIVSSLDLNDGDEIILPPYTMSACASIIILNRCVPVFADIDKKRLTISPESILKNITKKTRAIMVVHLLGCPAEMDKIMKIAKKYNLIVIEDAAQSPLCEFKNKSVCEFGEIGGYSLNFHKHIHTGEGGIIVTKNKSLALKCQLIRNHGENIELGKKNKFKVGTNFRFTELQAAIANEQLKKLKSIVNKRQKLANILNRELSKIKGLDIQIIEKNSKHSYYMYPIFYDEKYFGLKRNIFVRAVNNELPIPRTWDETPLAEGYVKPLYLNPIYSDKKYFRDNLKKQNNFKYKKGICPNTEDLYFNSLILTPLIHENSSPNDIYDLIKAIKKVLNNIEKLKKIKSVKLFDPIQAINKN